MFIEMSKFHQERREALLKPLKRINRLSWW